MEVDDGYFYLKMNMPVPKSPGKTSNDQTTTGPGVVHTHPKIDLPFSCAKINDQPSMRNGSTSTDLHGPDEGGGVAGDGHGAGDPPGEDEAPVERHERGDDSEHKHRHLGINNPNMIFYFTVNANRSPPYRSLPAEAVRNKAGAEGSKCKSLKDEG